MIYELQQKLSELGYEKARVDLTSDLANGDYTTNVAMQYAKERGTNPRDLADEIVVALGHIEGVKDIQVAGPGFINFYLEDDFLNQDVVHFLHDPVGKLENEQYKGERVMLEYTTQNILKEFHVGHLMSNVIGNAIANLCEISGAEIKRESYQGDVGMHIAKAVWGMKQSTSVIDHGADADTKMKWLGQCYAAGATAYEDSADSKAEIQHINKEIYSHDLGQSWELYQLARTWSLESFQATYDRLGINLDYNFFESQTADLGIDESISALEQGILEKSDGAIVFVPKPGEKLIPVVFINSAGLPTYAAKDLGLIKLKLDTWDLNKTIVFTAAEQNGHFKVIKHVFAALHPDLPQEFLTHIGHGYLSLTTGKMSSRSGQVLSADDALDQIKSAVLERMNDREIVEIYKNQLAEQIAQAALRFTILRGDIHRDVVFDFDQALSFEGDSGPYLQYSVVRLRAVLAKAHGLGLSAELGDIRDEDRDLLRTLHQLPTVVKLSATNYAPQNLVVYLLQLAQSSNGYYATNKVIDESDVETSSHRLGIISAISNALESGLNILGIAVPSEM